MKKIKISFDYSELCILNIALNVYKVQKTQEMKKEKDPIKKDKLYNVVFNADKLQDVIEAARGTF